MPRAPACRPSATHARHARFTLCVLVLAAFAPALAAAQPRRAVGSSGWASPALDRTLVAGETEAGLDAALLGGWGYTEDVLGAGDSHHRALGSLAVAGRPISFLTIAGRVDGRWDHHLGLGNGDESAVGEPRLMLRGDFDVSPTVALGLAATWFVPGGDAPSLVFEASTLELHALGALRLEGLPLTLALDVGWRFDGSARAVSRPVPFGRADLVSLGASDSDALLLRGGVSVAIDDTELFGEITADVLALRGIEASPVRIAAGVRVPIVTRLLSFYGSAEVGVGGRLPVDPAGTLLPIEPRLALSVGLVLSPRSGPAVPVVGEDTGGDEETTAGTGGTASDTARPAARSGRVLDPSGSPIAGATIRRPGDTTPVATTGADGAYTIEGVGPDEALEVVVEGYVTAPLGAEGASLTLERALPAGALRGLVRSNTSRAVTATVTVEPGGATATTDDDGVFELALAPGTYRVRIEADGYEPQTRSVEVEVGGVTVLNVDLRRSR